MAVALLGRPAGVSPSFVAYVVGVAPVRGPEEATHITVRAGSQTCLGVPNGQGMAMGAAVAIAARTSVT